MPMKRWVALAMVLTLMLGGFAPGSGFTEDADTVRLAQMIYALARQESYETKLALGTVAMNRVASPWFADTLQGVLSEQHQFPIGSRYDDECLSAAHEVLSGRRALDAQCVYYRVASAAEPRDGHPLQTVGGYAFFATEAVL